jgi:hypothetical protein
MLYLVKGRLIASELARFWTLLNDGTIEAQEPDGREIIASMRRAVMNEDTVEWQETCYCSPPLRHERTTVYDKFFASMETRSLLGSVTLRGESFWEYLQNMGKATPSGHGGSIVSMSRYVPLRIF